MVEREKIESSEEDIKKCIKELYINPRNSMRKWSEKTNQTAMSRAAYPSQHLASLITGVKGVGTSARGDDLEDGSEVKSCSRADQLGKCKVCRTGVLVHMEECSSCGSKDIIIKRDSHWIFSIKDEKELNLLLGLPRILLMLFDQKEDESKDTRLRVWIISPKEEYVQEFFKNYYYKNYAEKKNKGKRPAPCNLHPLKYDHYLMKPKLIFHSDIDKEDVVDIKFWDLNNPKDEVMPSRLLTSEQLIEIFGDKNDNKNDICKKHPVIPLDIMSTLKMRDKIIKTNKKEYNRR